MKKVSVIIDTDIGSDIDDTWALAVMLNDAFFDIKLVMTVCEDVQYKSALVQKLAEIAGKRIPVAAGVATAIQCSAQSAWLDRQYPHTRTDFEEAFAATVENEPEIVVVELGPMTNLARIILKYPRLAPKLRIVAMIGAIRKGYVNQQSPAEECNAALDPTAFRTVLQSGARVEIVPLDVCRDYIVDGEAFQKIKNSSSPPAVAVLENYAIWHRDYRGGAIKFPADYSSGILYDLLPVYYLRFPELFQGEYLRIEVTDEGRTEESEKGSRAYCLLSYKDRARLTEYLVSILTGGGI